MTFTMKDIIAIGIISLILLCSSQIFAEFPITDKEWEEHIYNKFTCCRESNQSRQILSGLKAMCIILDEKHNTNNFSIAFNSTLPCNGKFWILSNEECNIEMDNVKKTMTSIIKELRKIELESKTENTSDTTHNQLKSDWSNGW